MEMSKKRKKVIFSIILVTCILCSLLSTALTTALPQIMKDFSVSTATGQWLTSVYSLVMGIMVLATGFLIRRFSTKKLYLTSLGVFIVGLFLNAFASSFEIMMVGRVLQAAGNGILLSLGQVVILTIFPKEKRGSIMGIYGLAIGAAPVLAPTLAGLVVDSFGWRMIFYGMLVASTLAWFLTLMFFSDVLETEKMDFDFFSFLLCAIGFSGILWGVGNLGVYGGGSLYVWLPVLLGIISSGIFVHRQLHMETPFLELRVLKNKSFRTAVIASMLMYASIMASAILLPIHLQSVLGYSAAKSGLVTMPGSFAMAFISPFAGKYYDKVGIKKVFLLGAALLTFSNLGMVFIGMSTPLWLIIVLNIVRNIAIGCMMMPLVTWGMSGLSEEFTAHGTALLTSLRTVAGAFGSALFVAVFTMISERIAPIKGVNAAFAGLALIGILELVLAVKVRYNEHTKVKS